MWETAAGWLQKWKWDSRSRLRRQEVVQRLSASIARTSSTSSEVPSVRVELACVRPRPGSKRRSPLGLPAERGVWDICGGPAPGCSAPGSAPLTLAAWVLFEIACVALVSHPTTS